MPLGNSVLLVSLRGLVKSWFSLFALFLIGFLGLVVSSPIRLANGQEKSDKGGKSKRLTNQELVFFETKIRPVLANSCYACHSQEAGKSEGGLRLDTREGMLRGGDTGVILVPGEVGKSMLLKRIGATNPELQMPPKDHGKKLSAAVLKDFTLWVRLGAPDPRTEGKVGNEGSASGASKPKSRKTGTGEVESGKSGEEVVEIAGGVTRESGDTEAYRSVLETDWWSYKSLVRAGAPKTGDTELEPSSGAWAWTEIDRYVEAGYRAKGINPVMDADPLVLLRRLHYDLTGLPPSLQELESFSDRWKGGASRQVLIEEVVDRLMQTEAFAVHWARRWLDVARYGESSGREVNIPYNHAWRYRDWVIDAFRTNKPYDRFLVEQIAGDLLPESDVKQRAKNLVATGFLAVGSRNLNENNPKLFATDQADEQIDTVFQATMAMTMACARCHDHKFEPITQKQYTAVAGIFLSTDTMFGAAGGNNSRNIAAPIELPYESGLETLPVLWSDEEIEKKRVDLKQFRSESNEIQKEMEANRKEAKSGGTLDRSRQQELNRLNNKISELEFQLASITKENRAKILVMGVGEKPIKPAEELSKGKRKESRATANNRRVFHPFIDDSPIFARGDVDMPGEKISRSVPDLFGNAKDYRISRDSSGRLELASWIVSKENPVTSRVAVNRVWAWMIGQGIVDSVDNFGTTGSKPTHPELLDHLALEFIESGWDLRAIIRKVATSRVYQLSSTALNPQAVVQDPENRYCWRAKSRRLQAEEIRDSMLMISNRLDETPVLATIMARKGERNRVDVSPGKRKGKGEPLPEDRCRSIYLPLPRGAAPEVLELFDLPDGMVVQGVRESTNVPSQALYLLNNQTVAGIANSIAQNAMEQFPGRSADNFEKRTIWIYQKVLSRKPTGDELKMVDQLLKQSESGEAGWVSLVRGLLATAEFRYLD